MKEADSKRVYSTEGGRHCGECGKPEKRCECQQNRNAQVEGDGIVRVARESKGRKGKGVSLIIGLPLPTNELKALAKKLKQHCGSGGAVKGGTIEIQGEHRDKLVTELMRMGFQAKKSGA